MIRRFVDQLCGALCILTLATFAQAEPWPIDGTGTVHNIWHSYGQWQESGGIHLHEGIDLPAAGGTNVKAVKKGKVVNIFVHGTNEYFDYITISDDGNATKGWGYVHVKAANTLSVGDTVDAGDVIGTITTTTGVDAHLHFERDSDKNGGWPDAGGGTEHLDDDPLNYLNPATDNTFPTIEGIKYRRGEDEGNDTNPKYFTAKDCNNFPIIGSRAPGGASGNVDVLPSAFDEFGSFADKLSVQDITFHALGRLGDNTPTLLELVNFEGNGANDFAQQENNNFDKLFRDNTKRFAQAIYENDNVANSEEEGPFWYIVTNQDDDQITEATDDKWFWDTDGVKSEAWNDQLSSDERAANNAKDKFRDDFYDVYINVRDEAGNVTAEVETVLLDNWEQTVAADKFIYWLGETVFEASGTQHQESDPSIPLHVVDTLADCATIPSLGIEGSATTTSDADGALAGPVPVWVADKIGFFNLITDYDDDGIWHPRLDGDDQLVVIAHKWFRVFDRFIAGPPYPTQPPPITIEVSTSPTTIPIEIVELSLVSVEPFSVVAPTPSIQIEAREGGGVGFGEPTNNVDFDVFLVDTELREGMFMHQNIQIIDTFFNPGTLVDLGEGELFDVTVTPDSFEIVFEALIPESPFEFWFLTGEIEPSLTGTLMFGSVDVFTTDLLQTASIFDLFVELHVAPDQSVPRGKLYTMNLSAGFVPEPNSLAILALSGLTLLGARRRRLRRLTDNGAD